MADELPRVRQQQGEAGGLVDLGAGSGMSGAGPGYTEQMMEGEIQQVSRELYKAFSGKNQGFAEVSYSQYWHHRMILSFLWFKAKDQIAIDELSTHTDIGRQEAIHPYKA